MFRSQPYDIMVKPFQFTWDSQQFTTIESLQNFRGFFTSNIISLLFPIVLLSIWYNVSRDSTLEILPQPLVYCCSTSTRSYAKILEDRKIRRLLDLFVIISNGHPSYSQAPTLNTTHHGYVSISPNEIPTSL
jgi:hypothetical protein